MNRSRAFRSVHGLRSARGRRRLQVLTLGAGLIIAFGLLVVLFSVQASSTPKFCGSCHVMKPYYESWKASGHSSVACVECHIPPGVTAEFRKKYEALAMVARYFTGTYSTNPWAEVDDAACLRCHERRLIQGKETFHNALFDHRPHLTEVRRGMKLRCTSCHSQIVQGSHIAVTVSTCVLCHFKGESIGSGPARCTMCHEVPDRVVTTGNIEFDHGDVSRFGMSCVWCHEHVAEGRGGVPRERCFTCHNQQDRIRHYKDVTLLHQEHVTDHKVACMDCHLEIQHQAEPEVARRDTDCGRCHPRGEHSAPRDLYAGIGAKDVQPMPSPMFAAGVRCEGCHLRGDGMAGGGGGRTGDAVEGAGGAASPAAARADEVSCMACHGPEYDAIYRGWRQSMTEHVQALEKQTRQTERQLGGKGGEAWEDARYNLELVQRGRGVHNVAYAQATLEQAHAQLNAARAAAGLRALPLPWPAVPAGSRACMGCHQGIASQRGRFAGVTFSHQRHLRQPGMDCQRCHRPHAERAPGEVVRFDRRGCSTCHHQETGADCLTCHADVREREIKIDLGEFSHAFHLDDVELTCADCHGEPSTHMQVQRQVCADCHE